MQSYIYENTEVSVTSRKYEKDGKTKVITSPLDSIVAPKLNMNRRFRNGPMAAPQIHFQLQV